jgi:DNA-binding transcriptional LysR family regulator
MKTDLNDMLYFAEVAERGGFSAASRALGVPKSRLSRRMAELEAQLGVRLLQRTTRKLSLTHAGEAYLRHCQALRDAAQAANDAVAEVQAEPRGTLRVSCPVTLAQTVLGELVPTFLAEHPLVRLELLVSNRPVNLVEEGVDVALRVRQSVDDSGSLVVKRLDTSRTVLVASPALLARQGTPRTLEDLVALDSISMEARDGRVSWRLQGAHGVERVIQHSPRYVADDLLTLKFAALAGTGWCWLPDYMCSDEISSGQLVHLLPEWAPPAGVVHAVFATRRGLAPAVRHFLDFLGEHMPGRSSARVA